MGFLGWLTGRDDLHATVEPSPTVAMALNAATASLVPDGTRGVVSPWQTADALSVIGPDLFGLKGAPVTRAEAIRVPAVAKARNTIVALGAGSPLSVLRDGQLLPPAEQPTWTYRTSVSTPWHRMAWTLDDCLFYGWSLWRTVRGASSPGAAHRPILDAYRVPIGHWRFAGDGTVEVVVNVGGVATWVPGPAEEYALIPGHGEGLLAWAATTIRAASNIEASWAGKVRNPVPVVELHHTSEDELTPAEQRGFVNNYVTARADVNGAVIFTPHDIELKVHGDFRVDTLVEARNAVRLDVANYTGLPAEALDGSLSTASLTYTTQEGTRTELGTLGLPLYHDPIAARLSQDDIVPRGQYVRFNVSDLRNPTPSATGPESQD